MCVCVCLTGPNWGSKGMGQLGHCFICLLFTESDILPDNMHHHQQVVITFVLDVWVHLFPISF